MDLADQMEQPGWMVAVLLIRALWTMDGKGDNPARLFSSTRIISGEMVDSLPAGHEMLPHFERVHRLAAGLSAGRLDVSLAAELSTAIADLLRASKPAYLRERPPDPRLN